MEYSTRYLLATVSLVTAFAASAQQHRPLNKARKDSIRHEITRMIADDQRYRWMIMFGELDDTRIAAMRQWDETAQWKRIKDAMKDRVGISRAQKDSLEQLQDRIDSANIVALTGIIRTYGYPKKYVQDGDVALMLLHTPLSLIDSNFFPMLMAEVKNGNMPGIEYAEVFDKIQLVRRQPELYFVMEHKDKPTSPADLDATNNARKELGLPPLKKK